MRAYHDEEWGAPRHDDRGLFEMLVLEGAQAGLSWETILRKRPAYRAAFENFDIDTVAGYGDAEVERLLADAGIVRNRLKIRATITNARVVQRIREEHGSLDTYLWGFVDGVPKVNGWTAPHLLPATSAESVAMSRGLKRKGCSFVGPTVCYAFMQATGMVNDHMVTCFRHDQISPHPDGE